MRLRAQGFLLPKFIYCGADAGYRQERLRFLLILGVAATAGTTADTCKHGLGGGSTVVVIDATSTLLLNRSQFIQPDSRHGLCRAPPPVSCCFRLRQSALRWPVRVVFVQAMHCTYIQYQRMVLSAGLPAGLIGGMLVSIDCAYHSVGRLQCGRGGACLERGETRTSAVKFGNILVGDVWQGTVCSFERALQMANVAAKSSLIISLYTLGSDCLGIRPPKSI